MDLIMHDGVRGNFSHFIFCHTGVYLVALKPNLRAMLYEHKTNNTLKKATKPICKVFKDLQNRFEKDLQAGRSDLDSYRGQWLSLAQQQGFRATFFPKGQTPHDMLVVQEMG